MNPAIATMLAKYNCQSADDYINALRQILQEVTLLGLWRGKFFERAAFYGGTALRVLYGLDRFSEDMDFSSLSKDVHFDLDTYRGFLEEEMKAWGFSVSIYKKKKKVESAVESAFLKVSTKEHLMTIEAREDLAKGIPSGRNLKIKIEIDTDPPMDFSTETQFLLQPIPFSVRAFTAASMFAGKMHAVLCRQWKNRVKGRDWYDLVWYVSRGTRLDLVHLEARMRQSGHYTKEKPLKEPAFRKLLQNKIDGLDVKKAATDVERFLDNPSAIEVWSKDFFQVVAGRIAML